MEWRERVAREKVLRYRDEPYWGRPAPGFGDPDARLLIVGLAPAAHGANRTGRVFTGDASGDFLWAALHRLGLGDRASSRRADDGLTLTGVRIAAAVRCAPPANKPTVEERDTCAPFLAREIEILDELRVIVALGQFGWNAILRVLAVGGAPVPRPRPRFGHGAEARIGNLTLIGSYHPSQQNTFTGQAHRADVRRRAGAGARHRRDRPGGCGQPGSSGGRVASSADHRATYSSSRLKATPGNARASSMKASSIAIRWPRPMHSGCIVSVSRPPGACS